jgi:hypothetical protein
MKSQLTVLDIWWNIPQNVGPNELCIVWVCVCVSLSLSLSLTEGLRGIREREREAEPTNKRIYTSKTCNMGLND